MENKKLITVSLLSNAVLMGIAAQKVNADNVNPQVANEQSTQNVVDPKTEYNHVVNNIEAQSQQQVNQANQAYQVTVQNVQQEYNDNVTKLTQDANAQQAELKNQFNIQVNQVNQANVNYSEQENKYLQELEAAQQAVVSEQQQVNDAKVTLDQAQAAAKNTSEYKEAIKKYTTAVPASQVHGVDSSNNPVSAPTYNAENIISSEAQLPTTLVAPQTTAQTRAERSHYMTYYYAPKDDTSAKIYNGNLTDNQKLELADYAVTLVNSWRKAQGLDNVKFNRNVQQATEDLVQVRLANNLDYNHQNFGVRYQKTFLAQGLISTAENLSLDAFGRTAISKGYTTMLELKLAILNTATTMVYMDESPANQGGHTRNFRNAEYMGLALQYNPTSQTPYVLIWEMAKPVNDYLCDYYANVAEKEHDYTTRDVALRAKYVVQQGDYILQSTNKINQALQNGRNAALNLVKSKFEKQQAAYNTAANSLKVATDKYNAAKVALDNFRASKKASVAQANERISSLKDQLSQNLANVQSKLNAAISDAKNEMDKKINLAQQDRDKKITQIAAKKHELIANAQVEMDAKLNKANKPAAKPEVSVVAKVDQRGKVNVTESDDKAAVVAKDSEVKQSKELPKIIYNPIKHDFVVKENTEVKPSSELQKVNSNPVKPTAVVKENTEVKPSSELQKVNNNPVKAAAVVKENAEVKPSSELQKVNNNPVKLAATAKENTAVTAVNNGVQSQQESKDTFNVSHVISNVAKTVTNAPQAVEVVTNQFVPVIKAADTAVTSAQETSAQETKENTPVKQASKSKVKTENVMASNDETTTSVKTVIAGAVAAVIAGMSGLVIKKRNK
ncbi:SEC10/PgrA surface exclusion domain-containing protein [Ligilactobacillus hayakitensis]|uniref:SEC10/PgrA surface exclusion domain-containing protein n=1 Tax=Ligilactobacillus hayakitensis TaxID=396716 RepID=UPI0004695A3D|nr:SEC10/PgrA surface exclusion domain-containing protein [Ligilactobacillus hayakitensis]